MFFTNHNPNYTDLSLVVNKNKLKVNIGVLKEKCVVSLLKLYLWTKGEQRNLVEVTNYVINDVTSESALLMKCGRFEGTTAFCAKVQQSHNPDRTMQSRWWNLLLLTYFISSRYSSYFLFLLWVNIIIEWEREWSERYLDT